MLSGVTFSLRGDSIPTDGSGRVLVTDVNPDLYPYIEDAQNVICRSEIPISGQGVGDWFLHPTQMSTDHGNDSNHDDDGDRIVSPPPRGGWSRNRDNDDEGHRLVRLRRDSATAEEGVFTCNIPGDNNTPRYLGVYYPSESLCE